MIGNGKYGDRDILPRKMQGETQSLTQRDMIQFHALLHSESQTCNHARLSAHYAHILLGLQALIESYGPTPEYYEWLGQFGPRNTTDQRTFTIDL